MGWTNLKKWAEGKPLPLVWLGQMAAMTADECCELRRTVRGDGLAGKLQSSISPGMWVKFYRRHRQVEQVLIDSFWPTGISEPLNPATLLELRAAIRAIRRISPEELCQQLAELRQEDFEETKRLTQNVALQIERLTFEEDESPDPATVDEVFARPEVIFALRVWFPCWLEYGDHPPRLMRRARQGQMDALEKILWLDKLAIFEPRISRQWQEASWKWTRPRFRRMHAALGKPPKRKATRRKLKVMLCGLIAMVSEALESASRQLPAAPVMRRLTASEIAGLFDAVAKDTDRGQIDTDLPDDPGTLAKAIQREQAFWATLLGALLQRPDTESNTHNS